MTEQKRKRRYWYQTIFYDCPPCGASRKERRRVYGKPPARYASCRWVHRVEYNYCVEMGNL